MTNNWIPHEGWANPVREGETLVALRFRDGSENNDCGHGSNWAWGKAGSLSITHYRVTPPRTAAPIAEPATMSADEVLIRARVRLRLRLANGPPQTRDAGLVTAIILSKQSSSTNATAPNRWPRWHHTLPKTQTSGLRMRYQPRRLAMTRATTRRLRYGAKQLSAGRSLPCSAQERQHDDHKSERPKWHSTAS